MRTVCYFGGIICSALLVRGIYEVDMESIVGNSLALIIWTVNHFLYNRGGDAL